MARREEKPAAPDDTRRFDIFHNTDTDVYANLEECREELKHLCENSSFEGTEVILEINKRLAELNDVPDLSCMSMAGRRGGEDVREIQAHKLTHLRELVSQTQAFIDKLSSIITEAKPK